MMDSNNNGMPSMTGMMVLENSRGCRLPELQRLLNRFPQNILQEPLREPCNQNSPAKAGFLSSLQGQLPISYIQAAEWKKIPVDALKKLPFTMNLIKVEPKEIDFLNSDFKEKGYDSQQHYEW